MICFFFSSRRRHTRLQGDWSSDVCSSDLELVVQLLRVGRVGNLVAGPVDRGRVREVEDGDLVPLGRHLLSAQSTGSLHVLFEGVEVADGGWVQNGWAEVDFVERILGMPARNSTAGEERLQRLCPELVDGVALDDPRPAALELQIPRSEH